MYAVYSGLVWPFLVWMAGFREPREPREAVGGGGTRRRRGGQPGNANAVQHGLYSRDFTDEELADLVAYASDTSLADEIALARVGEKRLLGLIATLGDSADREDRQLLLTAIDMMIRNTGNIGRLLRQQKVLSGDSADNLIGAVATALDELGAAWGVDL